MLLMKLMKGLKFIKIVCVCEFCMILLVCVLIYDKVVLFDVIFVLLYNIFFVLVLINLLIEIIKDDVMFCFFLIIDFVV